jgi:uncharacterized protein with gpF-like domain
VGEPIWKKNKKRKIKRTGVMAQVVEHFPARVKPSSIPSTTRTNKQTNKQKNGRIMSKIKIGISEKIRRDFR